jgi:hypothetical protein
MYQNGVQNGLLDLRCNYLCSLLVGHGTDAEQVVVGQAQVYRYESGAGACKNKSQLYHIAHLTMLTFHRGSI